MRDLNLWASHLELGEMCHDTELEGGKGLSYPQGNSKGQAGWNASVEFTDLADLAKKLVTGVSVLEPGRFFGKNDGPRIERGEIVRLGILAHGDQGGQVAINGRKNLKILSPATVREFYEDLNTIGLYTREQGSSIIFFGCLAGQGEDGTQLLIKLSQIWPGRTIVGFSTTGYRLPGAMKRTAEPCEFPGMRDTRAKDYFQAHNMAGPDGIFNQEWSDLKKMPWASEVSPHAKTVKDGKVLTLPEGEVFPLQPPSPPAGTPQREGKRQGGKRGH